MRRDLVERAMAGDHDAFSELARVGIGRLYAAARLILRDDAGAEDATQETLGQDPTVTLLDISSGTAQVLAVGQDVSWQRLAP